MSTPLATAFVSVRADTKQVPSDIKDGFNKADTDRIGKDHGGRYSKGVSSGIAAGAKGIIGAAGAVFAAVGAANFISDVFGEATEAKKVGALTANVIKTTGGAAKVTQKQVEDLSEAISNKTGIDDEAIQSGANLLLTFKNVRNEVGKGNDVFSQATGLAQDLAASGFGDADTAAKMLGKALNDPVKGITALGKAGVTFSADQKKQIANFTKTGDLLSAQKIILGEVQSQVGGAAAATATPMEKLGVVVKNLEEDLGTALLPTIETVATWLSEHLPGAIDTASKFFTDTLVPAFKTVQDVVGPIFETIRDAISGVFQLFTNDDGADTLSESLGIDPATLYAIKDAVIAFKDGFVAAFGTVRDFIVTEIIPRYQMLFGKLKDYLEVALPIVQKFVDGLRSKLEPLMPQIQHIFETIGGIITDALDLAGAVIEAWTKAIQFIWENWGEGIITFVSTVWESVIGIIGPALDVIRSIIQTVTAAIHGDWEGAWEGIKNIVKGTFDLIYGIVKGAFDILGVLMSAAWSAIKAVASTAWDQIKQAVSERIDGLLTFVRELPGKITTALGDLGSLLYQKGKDVVQGFWDGMTEVWHNVTDWVGGIASWIAEHKGPLSLDRTLLTPAGKAIMTGFLEGLKSGAGGAWDFVTSVGGKTVSALQSALFGAGGGTVDAGRISLQGGQLDTDTFARINAALGGLWSLTQGSWSTSVAASAGTHAGAGVADIAPQGDSWLGAQAKLRAAGLDAWFRDWVGNQHIHLVNPHVSGLSSQALAQTLSFLQGGSGLAFDRGGMLPTGYTMAYNGTGSPERILGPHDQLDLSDSTIERLAYVMLGASGQAVGQLVGARTAAVRSRVR